MANESVLYNRHDSIATLTLNRPESLNAMNEAMMGEIERILIELETDATVRVVVLTGTGKGFCTGADLRASRPAKPRPEDAPERVSGEIARMIREGAQRLVGAILDCEKPVIAAVNGTAAGIGAHMAFAADLVIAAETARFIEVFVRRGLVPDGGGAYLLTRLVGPQRAKELMFFGDAVTAAEAKELGLVNKVVAPDDLDAAVLEWAQRLAKGPTRAIAMTKWLVNRSLEADRAGAFHDEALAQDLNMGTRDAQEGVQSFVERRETEFKGW